MSAAKQGARSTKEEIAERRKQFAKNKEEENKKFSEGSQE